MTNTRVRALVWLLRACGGLLLLAFPAAALPVDWMAATHRWLGLGSFPAAPVVDYLTRSVSLLYGLCGVLLLAVARDVRRFAPVILVLAWSGVAFGVAVFAVDLHAGMPRYWVLGEGSLSAALGGVFLWLLRGVDPD